MISIKNRPSITLELFAHFDVPFERFLVSDGCLTPLSELLLFQRGHLKNSFNLRLYVLCLRLLLLLILVLAFGMGGELAKLAFFLVNLCFVERTTVHVVLVNLRDLTEQRPFILLFPPDFLLRLTDWTVVFFLTAFSV
jgi:hypothetical protein